MDIIIDRRIQTLRNHLRTTSSVQLNATSSSTVSQPYNELVYVKKSNKYREATEKRTRDLNTLKQLVSSKDGLLLVKNTFAGIQASEIMISNGVYGPLSQLGKSFEPVVAGGEACGVIVDMSSDLKQNKNSPYQINRHVLFAAYTHGYTEYHVIEAKIAFPIPESRPEFVSIIISGTTAYLALEQNAKLNLSDTTNAVGNNNKLTCLVTGASGATGTFAVQFAKRCGYHVIGTCGDDEKKEMLTEKLHCDRVVNYKTENLDSVLRSEYPKGIDLIYEGVGGNMFDTCVKHLAKFGHIIIIGSISDYKNDSAETRTKTVPVQQSAAALTTKLLFGSKTASGFFLMDYSFHPTKKHDFVQSLKKIIEWYYKEKTLFVPVDDYCFQSLNHGVDSVQDAVEYLHSGRNIGKVFVQF
jgi:NADPH-dependent curcumin reductase CurA